MQYAGLLSAAPACLDGFVFDLQSCNLHDPEMMLYDAYPADLASPMTADSTNV
jgi:hypothetical protein